MDEHELIDTVGSILETNLVDSWEVATGETREGKYVFTKDFRMTGKFPKVSVERASGIRERKSVGQTNYTEEQESEVEIFFYCQPKQKYTDANGSIFEEQGSNDNASLCLYFIDQIADTIKAHADELRGAVFTFGRSVGPVFLKENGLHSAMIPITFKWAK